MVGDSSLLARVSTNRKYDGVPNSCVKLVNGVEVDIGYGEDYVSEV